MSVVDKIVDIANIIKEIETEDPGVAGILREGFGLSLNLIKQVTENGSRESIDISEHLEIVSKVLGVSLTDLVVQIMQSQSDTSSNKEPDQATLDFITSDLDDYEKFLAQNKAKDDLDFLSKTI